MSTSTPCSSTWGTSRSDAVRRRPPRRKRTHLRGRGAVARATAGQRLLGGGASDDGAAAAAHGRRPPDDRARREGERRADGDADGAARARRARRSEEHTSELQSLTNLVCRLLLEKKKKLQPNTYNQTKINTKNK